MSIKVITNETVRSGSEPMIEQAIRYLEGKGIDRRNVREVVITAEVGQPLMLDVSLYVEPESAESVPLAWTDTRGHTRVTTDGPSDAWGEQ